MKLLSLLQMESCCHYCRHDVVVIIVDMNLLSLLQIESCCLCCRQEVVVIIVDMKLLLVCLVLLGCSQVSTTQKNQLMKRLFRVLEAELEENKTNESKYLKCTHYVHDCMPVFSLKLLRSSPHQCILSCVSLDKSKCSCPTFSDSLRCAVSTAFKTKTNQHNVTTQCKQHSVNNTV